MNNYHTKALEGADIFTVMGSVYAEVARYDSALDNKQLDLAHQAAERASDIINYVQGLEQLSAAQKLEIKMLSNIFLQQTKEFKKSGLDNYLLPFAVGARMRQFK